EPEAGEKEGREFLEVKQPATGATEILVRASLPQTAVNELLDRVAAQAGLRTRWTGQALQRARGRSAALDIDNLPLPDVATALTDPLGVVWKIDDGVLDLLSEREAPAEFLTGYRILQVRRALRAALRASPAHPFTPAVYLEAGNLEAA